MVARLLGFDRLLDEGSEIFIRAAARQHTIEIVIEVGKEAGADLAIGGEADAAAGPAKGLRDGRDDANFSYAIVEGIAARSFTGAVAGQSHQRAKAVELAYHLLERNN